jgi:hypothetical protein
VCDVFITTLNKIPRLELDLSPCLFLYEINKKKKNFFFLNCVKVVPYFSPGRPIELLLSLFFSCSIYIVQCRGGGGGGDFVAQINFLCERLNFSLKLKI